MKRFQFTLESALDWRRSRFETEQAELARRQQEVARLEAGWRALEDQKLEAERELHGHTEVDAAELAALDSFRHQVDRRKRELESRISAAKTRAAEQSLQVQEARRGVRLIEVLKERKQREWRHEFEREQETLAAELYLARMGRG